MSTLRAGNNHNYSMNIFNTALKNIYCACPHAAAWLFALVLTLCHATVCAAQSLPFASTPEPGIDQGVSAAFAGTLCEKLISAGGANFPTIPAADGGPKRYYEGIYLADPASDTIVWQRIASLPAPCAYGVTIQTRFALYLIGGMNTEGASRSVYRLSLRRGKGAQPTVRLDTLPSLPFALDNAAGSRVGHSLYIIGGNADGRPSDIVLALNLRRPAEGWRIVTHMPSGPRVQPVCAAVGEALYVWGGFHADGAQTQVHTDGLRFDTYTGEWTTLPAPRSPEGEALTLAGGTATAFGHHIVCTGGVNAEIFHDAVSGARRLMPADRYMRQSVAWYRFNPHILTFDAVNAVWLPVRHSSARFARAGAAAIRFGKRLFLTGGELKPGIRTPHTDEVPLDF